MGERALQGVAPGRGVGGIPHRRRGTRRDLEAAPGFGDPDGRSIVRIRGAGAAVDAELEVRRFLRGQGSGQEKRKEEEKRCNDIRLWTLRQKRLRPVHDQRLRGGEDHRHPARHLICRVCAGTSRDSNMDVGFSTNRDHTV